MNMPNKIIILILSRNFSLSNFPIMHKFVNREGKFMNKLIGDSSSRKRKFYIDDTITSSPYKSTATPKNNKENSRRISVLNKLFMKSISEILMSSSISHVVLGKGLEISRVSVNQHFNQVNVFWVSSKDEHMEELEKILPDLGFSLRHELSQLKAIGVVPRIVFVKDKHYYSALKVDQLLSIADYGEDHQPLTPGSEFKEGASNQINMSVDVMNKEKSSVVEETGLEETNQEEKESFPEMTHDVFGLNHSIIMEKVMKRMNKAKAVHRYNPNLEIESEGISQDLTSRESVVDTMSAEERKSAISNFLLQRKILKRKLEAVQNFKDNSINRNSFQNEIKDHDEVDDFYTEDYIDEDCYEEDKR